MEPKETIGFRCLARFISIRARLSLDGLTEPTFWVDFVLRFY